MIKIQTLVSTMDLKNADKLLSEMHVFGDFVVVNQSEGAKYQEKGTEQKKIIDIDEKGLSKSRNLALENCINEIALIADDDIEYIDDYEKIIKDGFKKFPDADAIAFYLDSDDKKNKKQKLKEGRIHGMAYFKIASCQLAIKVDSLRKNHINFDEKFGAGSKYFMGEENILLSDMKRKGLKIYSYPAKIGTVREKRESTWFKKYDEKYFESRGAGYYRLSKILYPLYILQFAIRKKSLYNRNVSVINAIRKMFSGVSKYKKDLRNSDKIDFVILWVDGNDKKWSEERKKYAKQYNIDASGNCDARFRDWGLLKYWFRGVEKFAPWVNNIYFITEGHLPEWLNIDHPKLKIVKHADFMPQRELPTYNSNAIELSINKIKGLSEEFVLFNDDLFLINDVQREDFFKKGKPVNSMALSAIFPTKEMEFYRTVYNNIEVLNKYFDFKQFKKRNIGKILSLKQGKYLLWSIASLANKHFTGFANFHMPNSFKKSVLDEVWGKEYDIISNTTGSRFRNYNTNINQWLFNYWQFASGDFIQRNVNFGFNLEIDNPSAPKIIKRQKAKCICLNDHSGIKEMEKVRATIVDSFNSILPEKSSYEK